MTKNSKTLIVIKSLLVSLMLVSLSLFAFFAWGCSDELEVVDYGFKQEEINVKQNSIVTPETPLTILSNGEAAAVNYVVVNSNGHFIQVTSGSFIAEEIGGYTIKYAFIFGGEQVATKDIKVNVAGSSASLSVEYSEYIDTGVETSINATYPEGATVTYKVTYGEDEITVTDGKFIATQVGDYHVEVFAEKDGVSDYFDYTTFARTPSQKGEVESFGEGWALTREKSGITNKSNYQVVSSASTKLTYGANAGQTLKDRFGQDSNFLSYTTSGVADDNDNNKYIWLMLNARNDIDYYKQLKDEGYEYVSIWVYLDSQNAHHNEIWGTYSNVLSANGVFDLVSYPNNVSSTPSNPKLEANQWTEIKLGLYQGALGRRTEKISLISNYYYYKDGREFLYIDNSNGSPHIQETGKMTIYISDINVVRAVDSAVYDKNSGKALSFGEILNKNGATYTDGNYSYEAYCNGTLISNDSVLDNSKISVGDNTVLVKVIKDGKFYENRQISLTIVDTSKPMAFTSLDTDHYKAVNLGATIANATTLVNETVGGVTGSFIKVSANGEEGQQNLGVKVLPTVSKAALQAYSGGCIEFKYYATATKYLNDEDYASPLFVGYTGYNYNTNVKTTPYVAGEWRTVRIPVNDLLANFDYFVSSYENKNNHAGKIIGFDSKHQAVDLYISEITIYPNQLDETGENFGDLLA